jgi:hypothetical protein
MAYKEILIMDIYEIIRHCYNKQNITHIAKTLKLLSENKTMQHWNKESSKTIIQKKSPENPIQNSLFI